MIDFKEFLVVAGTAAAIISGLVGIGVGYGWLIGAAGEAFGVWGAFALVVATISCAIGAMAAWSSEKKKEGV